MVKKLESRGACQLEDLVTFLIEPGLVKGLPRAHADNNLGDEDLSLTLRANTIEEGVRRGRKVEAVAFLKEPSALQDSLV